MTDAPESRILFNVWQTDGLLGRGSFASVYSAHRIDDLLFRSAIKHISVPADSRELDELYAEGVVSGEPDAREYYAKLADELIDEIRIMYDLRGNANIVSYEDHILEPKADMPGFDIYIRMELLTPLPEAALRRPLGEREVLRLGMDICSALTALSRANIVHRDIKPANILVSRDGTYKLGDFGVARKLEASHMVLSKKGSYAYMAPEVFRGDEAGRTADIYSLGLVMHRLLNGNRAPFLPQDGRQDYRETELALAKRLSGSELPKPAYATAAAALVISRACAFRPEERFSSAADMRAALERCALASINDSHGDEAASHYDKSSDAAEPSTSSHSGRAGRIDEIKRKDAELTASMRTKYSDPEKQKRDRRLKLICIALEVLSLAVIAAIFLLSKR